MTPEMLRCRCGGEVRIVRLNARTLALGHVRNPGPKSHAVRLARAARNAVPAATGQPEASDASRREESLAPHLMTNSTRAASKGSSRTAPPPGPSSPARAGRVDARFPRRVAPRSARAG